jgi:RNA polymerase sigma-70 factor (ECF subfamily)
MPVNGSYPNAVRSISSRCEPAPSSPQHDPAMARDHLSERFIRALTDHQNGLFAYIVTLLGDLHEAHNVLQETNMVLWRRLDEFAGVNDFGAWSRAVAHYQVLAHYRNRKRDRHLFDEQLLRQIAEPPATAEDEEVRRVALRHCLASLPDDLRRLVGERYSPGGSVKAIAQRLGKSEGSLKMALLRTRQALMRCIQSRLAMDE